MRADPPGPMVGELLGHYRVEAQLGAGGMGVVYRAYDTRLHRTVAIKHLHDASNESSRARLLEEARAACALNHPNICTIYEVAEVGASAFIVMEFLDGQALGSVIPRGGLPLDAVSRYGIQIADALAHAHERRMVHRDLKPSNIIVTTDDRVKVLDFGLARRVQDEALEAVTRSLGASTASTAGTPAYMAPEVLRGAGADARSDVWALGVVLYEMSTGRRPYAGRTLFAVAAEVLSDKPIVLAPETNPALAATIRKCLEKHPAHRYRQAGEVRAALEAVHHGSGSAPLLPLAAAGRRIFSRRWLTAALVVVAAAIGAILIGKATASDAWRWFGAEPAIAFAERDWILVADFRNQTQDPVFDRALNTAMSVALSQSRWVNLVSSTRVRESLRRMEKPEPTPVDERVGREIAQREGLKLVIAPSIESSGGTYVLRAAIVEAAKGTALRTETVSAPNRNAVLPAVDELSRRIRLDLGEAAAVTTQTKPLAKVTTASLDALRQFTLAREAHTTQQFDKARSLYEEALHLDPTFTAARAMLGIINVEFFDRAKGLELLEQATKAVDGLTESERATVLGFHATFVEKNLQKAADQYRAYLAVYPDAATAHNNLGRVYMQMGRFDDAIAELETSIRLDPDLMLTYFSLNSIYLYRVADLDAAIALCARQLARDNRNVHAYDQLGWAHLGKGELRQAETAFRRAIDLNPKLPVYRYRLAHTLRLQGRYSDALDELRKILEIDRAEWSARYDTGVVLEAAGERTRARQELRRAIVDRDRDLAAGRLKADEQLELAAALARVGEKPRADALGRRAGALASDLYVERAGLLCLLGQRDQALQVLEQAVTGGFRDIVWIRVDPDLDALRADPRFQTLVANMPRVR